MTTLTDRQKMVEKELAKYTIDEGGHEDSLNSKVTCIMEAMCLVLGYDPYGSGQSYSLAGYLNPPCISKTIKDFLIGVNDHLDTNRQRGALKSVAPLILNTAPTKLKVIEYKTKPDAKILVQDKSNPEYRRAEVARRRLIKEAGANKYAGLREFLLRPDNSFRKDDTLDFIKQLVDVAKF